LLAELKDIWPEVKNVTFRTDGLLDHAIKSLNQAVRDLDDLIDDLCGAFNEFYSFQSWTRNLGFEIDICGFNFAKWLNLIGGLEDGLDWLNLNFELVDMFLRLYVQQN